VRIVPANEASCADLAALFARGAAATCRCQRYKLARKEAFRTHPPEVRARRLEEQTACGNADAAATSGLVAYVDGEPAGWCAVEPRPRFTGLVRNNRVPWTGRDEDKADATVWAVACLFTRVAFRRQGVSRTLARAAVEFARANGARALEAYPMTTDSTLLEELHVGTLSVFEQAGFTVATRPSPRRAVVRIDFSAPVR